MFAKGGGAIGYLAFVCGYLALIAWFKFGDVYHSHFSAGGPLVFAYNASRLLFIFYLFWIIELPGAALLRAFGLNARRGLNTLERLTLGFFAGAGIWHAALLCLGYLGLLKVWVAVAMTAPLVACSFPVAARCVRDVWGGIVRRRLGGRDWLAAIAIVAAALVLLMVKVLYPGGGSDYFSHYFYYYQTVVERGNLWPSELWYHYYEGQGAGLFFLAILLSDPLAPQLVTACFFVAAIAALYQIARDMAPNSGWPRASVMAFLLIYIYTPIWGQFEKQHELNAALIVGIVWTSARALAEQSVQQRRLWFIAAACASLAAVIVTHVTAIFLCAAFGALALYKLLTGQRSPGLVCVELALVAGFAFIAQESLDYVVSGLTDDRPFIYLWPIANVEKLAQWGALPMFVKSYWGEVGMIKEAVSLPGTLALLGYSLRLQLLFVIIGGGCCVALAATMQRLRGGKWSGPVNALSQMEVLVAAVLASVVLCFAFGRLEPVSFYRYSSFTIAIMIATGVWLWSMPVSPDSAWPYAFSRHWLAPPAVVSSILVLIFVAPPPSRTQALDFFPGVDFFRQVLPDAARFAIGNISLDQAYTRQVGWPGKPWGAIYPGARGAYAVVGPGVPIWSMHTTTFCMLPGCRMESVDSFSLGMGWIDVMFGSPEQGRAALQASGHNYFLISRELPIDDYLPRSPLFSPDNIGRYLGVRWTDGTTALLTWVGPGIAPVDTQWLAGYRRQVAQSAAVRSFPYDDMKVIFTRLRSSSHPWRWFPLPWQPNHR